MNEKLVVLLILSILGVYGDYTFNHQGRMGRLASLEEQNEALKKDLQTALEAESKIEDLKAEIAKTKILSEELVKQLPKRSEAGALLGQITTTSATKGMRFDAVTPAALAARSLGIKLKANDPVAQVKYEEMELSLTLRTSFREFGAYLERLENIPRLIDVDSFQVSAPQKPGPLSIRMRVKTYVYSG